MHSNGLSLENHLERDQRLDGWSAYGLGGLSHSTEAWVTNFLSFELDTDLPSYLIEMFDRAQACIVYGCYYYPLLSLGSEELFRFQESALREAAKESGASKAIQSTSYVKLIDWAWRNGLLNECERDHWHAARTLRNSASHKVGTILVGPNDAVSTLQTTVKLTRALFMQVRSTARSMN